MNLQQTVIGILTAGVMVLTACGSPSPQAEQPSPQTADNETQQTAQTNERECIYVEEGIGPTGQVNLQVEEVVTGLEVPWGIAFLSENEMLVSERSGQIRRVNNGELQPNPIATIDAVDRGEGGLLDIAAHPEIESNGLFYLYYTGRDGRTLTNRVERWQLAEDGLSATRDLVIIDNIPVAQFHNGGRLRFGPDGMLYIGTGDARDPQISQDVNSLAGKILRVTPDGDIPEDNPFGNNPVFLTGIRNTQGFDWYSDEIMWVSDHGPSGELGRRGQDKVSVANPGDNLGWPTLQRCETQEGMIPAAIIWQDAVPPGGAAIYRGDAIPEWQGSFIIGALGAQHLHRIEFAEDSPYRVASHEVYLQGEYGRLREVIMGPDNELYVTTSNCDGRGNCPPEQDKILRITR